MTDEGVIWRCPICRGSLTQATKSLRCEIDAVGFEVIDGIPDLRDPRLASEETERDRISARILAGRRSSHTPEQLVAGLFAAREGHNGWSARDTALRTRQSATAVDRLRHETHGWLAPALDHGSFLDLGCGLGGLLTAAAGEGRQGIGIDNRMEVLVIAKRMIEQFGGRPILAAAQAESLPLADDSVGGVVMYDVAEHITDLPRALSEVSRVTRPGGILACSTPNRFSLAPEPHVFVWGVGWLPRRYQRRYVNWRSGRAYEQTWLRSPNELAGLLRDNTRFDPKISVPPISAEELRAARGARATLGKAYNLLVATRAGRLAGLRIGPFFRVIATKHSPDKQRG